MCSERAIVETTIGRLKEFKLLDCRFPSNSVELQKQVILICAELTQLLMMRSLLRPEKVSNETSQGLFELSQSFSELSDSEIKQKINSLS